MPIFSGQSSHKIGKMGFSKSAVYLISVCLSYNFNLARFPNLSTVNLAQTLLILDGPAGRSLVPNRGTLRREPKSSEHVNIRPIRSFGWDE